MAQDVMFILNRAITGVTDNFIRIFFYSGVSNIYYVCILIFFAVRFILMPLRGAAIRSSASDTVKSHKKKGTDDE